MERVTADSNIYVSALNYGGKPQQLLELARHGEIELAASEPILTEVTRVLAEKFHWEAEDVQDAREQIGGFTRLVTPTDIIDVVKTDPDDNRVLECAVAAGSGVIVSGDSDLLRLGRFQGIEVMKVSDFLARSEGQKP